MSSGEVLTPSQSFMSALIIWLVWYRICFALGIFGVTLWLSSCEQESSLLMEQVDELITSRKEMSLENTDSGFDRLGC